MPTATSPTFFSLPAEIRLNIYHHTFAPPSSCGSPGSPGLVFLGRSGSLTPHPAPIPISILYASSQCYHEAVPVLYSSKRFVISRPPLDVDFGQGARRLDLPSSVTDFEALVGVVGARNVASVREVFVQPFQFVAPLHRCVPKEMEVAEVLERLVYKEIRPAAEKFVELFRGVRVLTVGEQDRVDITGYESKVKSTMVGCMQEIVLDWTKRLPHLQRLVFSWSHSVSEGQKEMIKGVCAFLDGHLKREKTGLYHVAWEVPAKSKVKVKGEEDLANGGVALNAPEANGANKKAV